jgi:replicative DNA helicase
MAEATADMIILIYPPMYYVSQGIKIVPHPQMPPVAGTSYIIVAKHRDGPIGFIPMSWIDKYARWGDLGPKVKALRQYNAED